MKTKKTPAPPDLVETTKGSFVTISAEGIVTDSSEASIKTIKISQEELVVKGFSNQFTEEQQEQKKWQHIFEKGFIKDHSLTVKHKKEKQIGVLYDASIYEDSEGITHGFFTKTTNSKFQKLAAQYSHSLIEASLDPLITIDSEGKITDMNEALVHATGVSRTQLTGSNFFEYFTEKQKA